MKKGRLPMEENKKDTAPETEAPKAEATPAGETPETEKKEKKDKKFFHKEQKELEAAKAQLAEKENQYLRLYAEYENFRKRSEKEKTDCYNTAYGDALTAFLPLIDSMTQALQFSPEDQGIKALAKQLSDILAKLNITEIESDGAQFDPNVHNAIMHEENPELGENVVTQTFQKGYKRGDKVLRCAMVKVAN
jgi:molecular chaperone GrpE